MAFQSDILNGFPQNSGLQDGSLSIASSQKPPRAGNQGRVRNRSGRKNVGFLPAFRNLPATLCVPKPE